MVARYICNCFEANALHHVGVSDVVSTDGNYLPLIKSKSELRSINND